MTVAIGSRNVAVGALLAGVGGLLAIVGALLFPWYSVSGKSGGNSMSVDFKGMDSTWGILALVLGIAAIALAVVWIQEMKILPAQTLYGILIAVGVVIVLVAILGYVTDIFPFKASVTGAGVTATVDMSAISGSKYTVVQKFVEDATKTSGVSGGFAIGFFLEVAAGIAIAVGGALGLTKKSA